LVQSRKVCRITVEFPIERAGEVIRLLGFPAPHSTTRCAVALLNDAVPLGDQGKAAGEANTSAGSDPAPAAPKPPRAPRKWEDMPMPEQVGVRCQDQKFWRYLGVTGGAESADKVRNMCVVQSRKKILPGTAAGQTWMNIERDYQAWQKAPSMGVEI
jgi:hypothetical protein